MKQLDNIRPEATEMHAVAPVKRQKVSFGKLRPKPGQKVWQCDLSNGQITEAIEEDAKAFVKKDGSAKIQRQIKLLDNHWYCVAINKANAERKFIIHLEKILGRR